MKITKIVSSVIACAIAASCATPEVGEQPEMLGDVVRGMGYTEVRRPLAFWEPGAIIAVTNYLPFDGSVVCSPAGALGANFFPAQSGAMASSWRRAVDRGFSLGATVKAINAKLGFDAVQDISLQLSNPVVYEISDEVFFAAIKTAPASDACKRAIGANVEAGRAMAMIRSALKADVVYNITYNQGIDASLKYGVAQAISAEIAARAKANGEDSISATQLIFGVIDDKLYLTKWAEATPGLPALAAPGFAEDQRRLIPVDVVITGAVDAEGAQ